MLITDAFSLKSFSKLSLALLAVMSIAMPGTYAGGAGKDNVTEEQILESYLYYTLFNQAKARGIEGQLPAPTFTPDTGPKGPPPLPP